MSKNVDTPLLKSLATTLGILCKVRGPKVVVRFFDNEARHVEPMLKALLSIAGSADSALTQNNPGSATVGPFDAIPVESAWQLRYILLLWLGHLMLTPFDLSSVGSVEDQPQYAIPNAFPAQLPSIAKATVHLGLHYILASTKEQSSAAKLLVNLASRPDMQRLGLFRGLIALILSKLSIKRPSDADFLDVNGHLRLLHVLLRSTNSNDIAVHLPSIFAALNVLLDSTNTASQIPLSSSLSKKLVTKLLREIAINLLQIGPRSTAEARQTSTQMLQENALEDIIDHLLEALGDQDTQGRLAASKALAIVTAKLENDMAHELVDVVIAELGKNVRQVSSAGTEHKDLSTVNPLRWHGLTMTLAHMLFRRSAAAQQLTQILEALYLSLAFEQRSTSGSSIGINVRDAANFGLWSLARRYTTKELIVANEGQETSQPKAPTSKIQTTATHLLVAACLDSAGNVRRGASAALQELIGRHPDMVDEGIAVIQTVDYHAVGLRRRAMIDVAFEAAQLSPDLYRVALWDGLLGWRGLQAPDVLSRNHAAISLGRLSGTLDSPELISKFSELVDITSGLQKREVEWRHGLVQAISAIVDRSSHYSDTTDHGIHRKSELSRPIDIAPVWRLFDSALSVSNKDLSSASMRPDLMTSATIRLIGALSRHVLQWKHRWDSSSSTWPSYSSPTTEAINTLDMCLKTADPSTLDVIPATIRHLALILSHEERMMLCKSWLRGLDLTKMTPRRSGYMIALASLAHVDRSVAVTSTSSKSLSGANALHDQVCTKMFAMFRQNQSIEIRVTCLQCFTLIYMGPESCDATRLTSTQKDIAIDGALTEVLETSLNDYTINERGDVGSLLRLEAIATLGRLVTPHIRGNSHSLALPLSFKVGFHRLALERLDKVRLEATHLLRRVSRKETATEISIVSHFRETMSDLLSISSEARSDLTSSGLMTATAFWKGISSSAGAGADSLMQTARSALFLVLDELPVYQDTLEPQIISLHMMLTQLLTLLSTSLADERVLLPMLETISFILDAGIFARLADSVLHVQENIKEQTSFKYLTLLSLIQKSHFKSTNLPKLFVCVQIYCGLALLSEPAFRVPNDDSLPSNVQTLKSLRLETLKKLVGMLLHPYAKVRIAAAEALFVTVESEAQALMKGIDWGESDAEGRKVTVRKLKGLLGVG